MFTFGEASKQNWDSEFQSTYSLKDEIDKLNFIIEEKEYMNAELRQEILILREKSGFRQNITADKETAELKNSKLGMFRNSNSHQENEFGYVFKWNKPLSKLDFGQIEGVRGSRWVFTI